MTLSYVVENVPIWFLPFDFPAEPSFFYIQAERTSSIGFDWLVADYVFLNKKESKIHKGQLNHRVSKINFCLRLEIIGDVKFIPALLSWYEKFLWNFQNQKHKDRWFLPMCTLVSRSFHHWLLHLPDYLFYLSVRVSSWSLTLKISCRKVCNREVGLFILTFLLGMNVIILDKRFYQF